MNFHSVNADGSIEYLFYRNPGADTQLAQDEISPDILDNAAVVHFDSLCFSHEPFNSTCRALINTARETGVVTSLDTNYREPVWPGDAWVTLMEGLVGEFDVVKMNMPELKLLYPHTDTRGVAEDLASRGVKCVLITDGENGCMSFYNGVFLRHGGFAVGVVDTIGCGDAFTGTFLAQISVRDCGINDMPAVLLEEFIANANAAAALTATKKGAMTALPNKDEIMKLRNRRPAKYTR